MKKRFKMNRILGILISFVILSTQGIAVKASGNNETNSTKITKIINQISKSKVNKTDIINKTNILNKNFKSIAVNVSTAANTQRLGFTPVSVIQDPNDTVLYMTDYADKRVVAYNYATNEMSYVQFLLQPENITLTNGLIYVCLLKAPHSSYNFNGQGAIGVIDISTFKTSDPEAIYQFDVDLDPYGITADNNGNIYVSGGSGQITELRCYNGIRKQLISKVSNITEQADIQYDTVNNKIYYTSTGEYPYIIGVINVNNGQMSAKVDYDTLLDLPKNKHNIFLSPDGKCLFSTTAGVFTAGKNDNEQCLQLKKLSDISGWEFSDFTFNSDDNLVYTAHSNQLYVMDYDNFNFIREYNLDYNIQRLFYKDNKIIALTYDSNNNFYLETMDKPAIPKGPSLVSSSIEDGSMNVPLTNQITLTFNENIHLNDSSRIWLFDEANNDLDITPTVQGNTLTITLNNSMNTDKLYGLLLDTTALASDNNTPLTVPIFISFSSELSESSDQAIKYINQQGIIIDKDTTINGDFIVKGDTTIIIENGAALHVTGNLICYGDVANFGKLTVDGTIYCQYPNYYRQGVIDYGNLYDYGTTVDNNISKVYPEPFNFLTPNCQATSDKYYINFTGFAFSGSTMTINGQNMFNDTDIIHCASLPCMLVTGNNNISIEITDFLGNKFDKTVPVNCTAKEYTRLAGANRFDTSVQISKYGWTSSKIVVLATGEAFPDALAAAPLAAKLGAPILLTESKVLTSSVKDEIKRLGASQVIIIGGTGAVSQDTQNLLVSMGLSCSRIAGSTRFDTAVAIAKVLGPSDTVVVATGTNFPDVLSVAPFAAAYQMPILLTNNSNIPASVTNYIKNNNVKHTIVVGGSGVISDASVKSLPDVIRLAGANRYQTNYIIVHAFKADLSCSYFATGLNFPDALAGAPSAAYTYSPVILVDSGMDQQVLTAWQSYKNNIRMKMILGGTGAVSNNIMNQIFN